MRVFSAGLWRNPDFVKLWVAQTISLLGSSVSFLALPLIAVSLLNATPVQMGVLAAVNTLLAPTDGYRHINRLARTRSAKVRRRIL